MSKDPEKNRATRAAPEATTAEEQIRQRAYELYKARGREDGHDLDDWLQAKSDVESKLGLQHKTTAA